MSPTKTEDELQQVNMRFSKKKIRGARRLAAKDNVTLNELVDRLLTQALVDEHEQVKRALMAELAEAEDAKSDFLQELQALRAGSDQKDDPSQAAMPAARSS